MSKIHIVFGPQGAGKSTYSKKLSKEVNGVHFSIDAWIKSIFFPSIPTESTISLITCFQVFWTSQ